MKTNSVQLYDYVNDLGTDEKVKFKVYRDDVFTGEIVYWDGENFNWESGRFSSGAFFNPLYDFEKIEEDKDIKGVELYQDKGNTLIGNNMWSFYSEFYECVGGVGGL